MNADERLTTDVSTHFAFGKNWADYATTIDEPRVASAVENMKRLLGRSSLEGLSFVDVGCGSGIHSLAALRLGASRVQAIDIDPDSVETTRRVLTAWAPERAWDSRVTSVFDLPQDWRGTFDVVYSWGVLHHTGAMWPAVREAATLARPGGGIFALALYRKTPLCGLWRVEKRLYRRLPRLLQLPFMFAYSAADLVRLTLRGHNPVAHVREYKKMRGMNFWHDAHDWLGGYPYESASAEEVARFMDGCGFAVDRSFYTKSSLGITGSGCAEYLLVRRAAS